ncbi:MAG TPA: hypothetical protein VKP65_15810 [Rhodothermales bacterium]|nr:hypothetical protein [Rhodothermales bacterium]
MTTRMKEITVVLALLTGFVLLAVLTMNLRTYMQEHRAQVATEQAAPPAVNARNVSQQ